MQQLDGNGFVLAGGRSRRMGRDKASLAYAGKTLALAATDTLLSTGLHVRILVRVGQELEAGQVRCLEDRTPDLGPLGALSTALSESSTRLNCFLPCDMPEIPASLFFSLASHAGDYDFVAARDSSGRTHHLCAQLAPTCLGPIDELILEGALQVDALLNHRRLRVRILEPEEHGLADSCFLNLNRPDDLT